MRVGLYARISEDTAGHALGVARQEADCRTAAQTRGWEVVGVYVDNDVSAFKAKVVRPQFERLLADVEAGRADGIVAYDLDRFARQPTDLERAIRLFDARPLVFATVQSDIDLSTSDGRTMARVLVAFANKSSMDTSRRVRRKHLELAMKGVPVGGHRPFGYEADKVTINPKEATLIRQAATDLTSGIGLHTIARRWNDDGILTTAGNPWRRQVLRHMMLSPRLAGYRVYQGEIARDQDGKAVTGLYPPILDIETWETVCAFLNDPARKRNVHKGGRKYLLSGIVRCALCGGSLQGNADTQWGTFAYSCKSPTNGGCGRVSISGPKLDELISELVVRYLSGQELKTEDEPWEGEDELSTVSNRVQELMSAYSTGELSSDAVFPVVSKLEDQVRRLRSDRAAWLRERATIESRPANITDAWPNMDIDQRRAVIGTVLHAVAIKPSSSRGGRFDPDRAEPVWR